MLKNDLSYTPLEFFSSDDAQGNVDSFDSQAFLIQKARDDYRRASELREEEAARQAELARIERVKAAEEEERRAREEAEAAEKELQEKLAAEAKKAAEEAAKKAAEETARLKAEAKAEAKAKAEAEAELEALKKANAAKEAAEKEAAENKASEAKTPAHASSDSLLGLEETEPGVAGPTTKSAAHSAPAKNASPISLSPSMDEKVEQAATKAAIQLVPKKASLWQRIKFLFTGRLN